MERNTRLQVEHPVTEVAVAVAGHAPVDVVEWQRDDSGRLVWMLDGLGIQTCVDLHKLAEVSRCMARQLGRPSSSRVVQALS